MDNKNYRDTLNVVLKYLNRAPCQGRQEAGELVVCANFIEQLITDKFIIVEANLLNKNDTNKDTDEVVVEDKDKGKEKE